MSNLITAFGEEINSREACKHTPFQDIHINKSITKLFIIRTCNLTPELHGYGHLNLSLINEMSPLNSQQQILVKVLGSKIFYIFLVNSFQLVYSI